LDPTEVEQDDLDNDEILLIWDFDVDELLSENAIAITPATSTDVEEYPQAPLLDINAESLHCNCSKFPNADKIMIVSEDDSPGHSTADSAEPEEGSFERDINNAGIFCNTYVQIHIRVGQKLSNS
jgi:hypothetical protein